MISEKSQLSEAIGPHCPQPPSIRETFLKIAERSPHAIAVVSAYLPANLLPLDGEDLSGKNGYLRWTYTQLKTRAVLLAHFLSARGISKGMPIGCLLVHGAEYALVAWTATIMRCPIVLLNPKTVSNVREMQYMLDLSQPAVLFVPDDASAIQLEEVLQTCAKKPALKILASVHNKSNLPADYLLLESLFRDLPQANGNASMVSFAEDDPEDDELALIAFSSGESFSQLTLNGGMTAFTDFLLGTTSFPKAILHTTKTFSAGAFSPGHYFGNHSEHIICNPLPAHHAFGTYISFFSWLAGATICYPSAAFNPVSSLQLIEAERCTLFPAVPTIITALSQAPALQKYDISSIQTFLLAGTLIFPEMIRICTEQLKAEKAIVIFASTENPSISMYSGPLQPGPVEFAPCGWPTLGAHFKLCLPGETTPIRRGEPGEIHVTGIYLCKG